MMRKLLNNPKVILPLAVIALLWVLVSYGVISPKDFDLFNSGRSTTTTFSVARKNPEQSESGRAVESLIKEQWLPRSWQKYSVIKHEPFVADFVFDELQIYSAAQMANSERCSFRPYRRYKAYQHLSGWINSVLFQ